MRSEENYSANIGGRVKLVGFGWLMMMTRMDSDLIADC
jgi:hypothetical protein